MRGTWARDTLGQAVHLDLHGGTPYALALDLPLSLARGYFEHPTYQQHAKAEEARQRMDIALLERVDSVRKAIYALGKALSGRR